MNHGAGSFRSRIKLFGLCLGLTLVAACASLEQDPAPADNSTATAAETEPQLSTSVEELAAAEVEEAKRDSIVYKGSDNFVKMPPKSEPVRFVGEAVSLNFEQAPLGEVTHAIMGDILGLDYILDHPVQGVVTLRTRTPVPRDQLLSVLESLLAANNSIMIRGEDGRYLITGAARGRKLSPRVSNPGDENAGYSTIIVPLEYIGAAEMAEILQPVADESAFVRVDSKRNLLMLAGTREQLDGWLDMVTTFDVDQLAGMSVGLFPLENSSVTETHTAVQALLASAGEGANLGQMVRIIPVERLNSLLVVTPRSQYLDKVEQWIRRLDEAHYSELDRRLYVYPVQNTTARRLADLLNSIYSGTGSQGGGSGSGQGGGVAPGLAPETVGTGSAARNRSAGFTSVEMSGNAGGSDAMLDGVRVVADEENNALMVYATALQYRVIEEALQQLDIVATQVIIEASIMEVSLTDDLSYGLEWTFKNGLGDDYDGTGLLTAFNAADPVSIVPGFSYTVTNSIGDVSAVLNALAKESLLNIISTPSVMVLDNHSAYIHVGQQVPIIDSQTTSLASDTDRVTQSVIYRDTGVKLEVTPSVNAGGLVTMDISQSVTDVGDIDDATGQRRFLERNIVSRVAVRSSESVVLGGLIRENAATASQGVPWLHSIPVVGTLFGTDTETDTRTELLVIITPRAIYNESELRAVSDEMRKQLRHLELIDP